MSTTYARALAALYAIINEDGTETLADVVRSAYKYTDAGIAVSFRGWDGMPFWSDDKRLSNNNVLPLIRDVGVSCIVEGSDAAVPITWLDLTQYANASEAMEAFKLLCGEVDAEASALWDEAHPDGQP